MKLLLGQPKFWQALFYDTIGQEDKAKALLNLGDIAAHKNYWLNVAVFCAVAGVAGAPFTYGASLLLLLVSARKLWMYKSKKVAPTPPVVKPVGLLSAPVDGEVKMDIAVSQTPGKKTMTEKSKWQIQNLAIQFRVRRWLKPVLMLLALAVAGAGGAALQKSQQVVAPKTLCECPLGKEAPKAGKAGKPETKKVEKK